MNAVAAMPIHDGAEILLDVPASDYHRRELGVATNSTLKIIRDRSPAHYRAWVDAEDDNETPPLLFGLAYHMRVLEPERYAREYQVMPSFGDMRSSNNRAKRDEWLADNPGVTTVSAADGERIEAMHTALMAHPLVAGIMREGHSEVTMRWIDEPTGVRCRARVDWWVPGKLLMDLKTTDDASPRGFVRSIDKYGYHAQHSFYCEAARCCGETIRNYLILAQEKEPPYVAAVYHVDTAAEIRGYELISAGLQTMRDCLASDTWPGYSTGITQLSLPPWSLKD